MDVSSKEYKLVSGEQNIQSINMEYFNWLAKEYEEYIKKFPQFIINRANYLKFNP